MIKEAIETDGSIIALLPGGVHAAREISRPSTPDAFDSDNEILPCALVKVPSESSEGPAAIAGRQDVDIYLYERDSFTNIDAVMALLFTKFHLQKIGTAADKVWEMIWTGNIRDQEDSALRCNLHVTGFQVVRNRS